MGEKPPFDLHSLLHGIYSELERLDRVEVKLNAAFDNHVEECSQFNEKYRINIGALEHITFLVPDEDDLLKEDGTLNK
jgi:hypothetical protein